MNIKQKIGQKELLLILMLIILIKFLYIPLIDWQQSVITSNQSKFTQLIKSTNVINETNNIKSAVLLMESNLSKINDLFYDHQPDSEFKLKQQQWLEKVFSEHRINIINVGWQAKVPLKSTNLVQYDVSVSFMGQLLDLQQLQVFIDRYEKRIVNNNFNYRFTTRKTEVIGEVNGRIQLSFFMRDEN